MFKIPFSPTASIYPGTSFHHVQEFVVVQFVLSFVNYYLVFTEIIKENHTKTFWLVFLCLPCGH